MSTMSRRTFLSTLGLTALGALLASCGGSVSVAAEARSNKPRQSAPQVTPDDLKAFADGHNRFGLAMYRLLGGGNLFFSPYSIAQVLTMTSAGARGQTAQQMAQALHSAFPQERLHPAANALDQALSSRGAGEDGFPLEVANSIWGQQGFVFQPDFIKGLNITVDYSAITLNGWRPLLRLPRREPGAAYSAPRMARASTTHPGARPGVRVPVDRDHGFRRKVIIQSGRR